MQELHVQPGAVVARRASNHSVKVLRKALHLGIGLVATSRTAIVVRAAGRLGLEALDQCTRGRHDGVDGARSPVPNLLGMSHPPEHLVGVCGLVAGVAPHHRVALPHRVGHVAGAERRAVASVASDHHLSIPGCAFGHPNLEIDERVAAGGGLAGDAAERRQVGNGRPAARRGVAASSHRTGAGDGGAGQLHCSQRRWLTALGGGHRCGRGVAAGATAAAEHGQGGATDQAAGEK